MSDQNSEPKPPRKAGLRGLGSVLGAALNRPAVRRCFLLPLSTFVVAFGVALIVAPEIDSPREAAAYSSLFSTSAQVIVTLLVALVLEVRALPFENVNARRLIAGGTLGYIAVGVVAAVLALSPTLGAGIYKLLFAVTLAAGAGALLSVLAIGFYIFQADLSQHRASAV